MSPNHSSIPRNNRKGKKMAKSSGTSEQAQAPRADAHDPQMFHGCVHNSAAHCRLPDTQHAADSSEKSPEEQAAADRRFRHESEYPPHFTLQDIQIKLLSVWICLACPSSVAKCRFCKQYDGHGDIVVAAIHGECVTEGNTKRSAIGIWYGDGNCGNTSQLVSRKGGHHTKQKAELDACLRVLRHATVLIRDNRKLESMGWVQRPFTTLVIKTDSEYVVNSLTEWLPKWKANGWKTCKGTPVANAEVFKLLEAGIVVLEEVIKVKFWLVPKEDNKDARFWAQQAFTSR
ncbi:hypothetical protein N7461_002686 [Penicillium sp. DV-2018c]|nr:hypothetical protein N7461_002686 [Penicillium sp. DV-2018c]